MAANSKRRDLASFGKRVVTQIWTPTSRLPAQSSASALSFRRGAHDSVYDKNPDDQIRPTIVPDEVMQPLSDKYWAPHPQTGIFGPPATDQNMSASEDQPTNGSGEESVLEQKAWFRPTSIEDLEKPIQS